MEPRDASHLRAAFALAFEARRAGHRPFGAILADAAGEIARAGSTQGAGGDATQHAEMNALRAAMAGAAHARLAGATLYASNEPCAMCAAAAFYAGVRRIAFGFPESRLRPLRNRTARGAGLAWSCREILARAAEPVEILGPCLEDEAAQPHEAYWDSEPA
jgi:tRNA(adenine34) deaminase